MLNLSKHQASTEDLKAIEKALQLVWLPKLDFIFKDRTKINKAVVISYDSRFIYLWRDNKLTKIPHDLKIPKEFHLGWRAGLLPEKIKKFLPFLVKNKTRFEIPIISGGLLTPFIELQEQKELSNNPYITKESYLATIIHEFGHVYWEQHKLWWFSDKINNLEYLKKAHQLFQNDKSTINRKLKLFSPSPLRLSELFAFCTEYSASEFFLPLHKTNLDKFYAQLTKKIIELEKAKNLDTDTSVLDLEPYHDFSAVLGIILLELCPKTWPNILTSRINLMTSSKLTKQS